MKSILLTYIMDFQEWWILDDNRQREQRPIRTVALHGEQMNLS